MDWPLASDFSTVLQKPEFAFKDSELKKCAIERDSRNQPRARSGAFANVYKATLSNGRNLAVRVFTSGAPERRERYQEISSYLKTQQLDSLVEFSYRDDGIRSMKNGKFYPLVTMEWVRGEQLFEWVNKKCQSKDNKSLSIAADRWLTTIKGLNSARIAHGDLQHGNVMVTDQDQLKLVDYDCMCVPNLIGRKNLEIGVDPYQHPSRNPETLLNPDLDNFSALFIFVALRALAASPALWMTYVASINYDKLLFRREDLHDPTQSALIKELRRSPDQDVQRLTKELVDLTQADINRIPRLEELLFSFSNVETLLNQRDFDAAINLLTRNQKQVKDAPPQMQPRLIDAQERVKRRIELENAVSAGDEQAMQRIYQPKLFDDYPKAQPLVTVARQAPQVIPILVRLQSTSQAEKWRDFVKEWDTNQVLLAPRKSAERFAPLARTWRDRNQACDQLLGLLRQPSCDGDALASIWDRLTQLGGHPEATAQRAKIDGILNRQRAWTRFKAVPHTAEESIDAQLVQAWNEALFAGWNEAEQERPRVDRAKLRLEVVQKITAFASRTPTLDGENTLVKLAAPLGKYQFTLQKRIEQAHKSIDAVNQVVSTLREPASDLAIVKGLVALDAVSGRGLLGVVELNRIELAEKRSPILTVLQTIPPDYNTQQAPKWDPKLLQHWTDNLLTDCSDASPWKRCYEQATARRITLDKLKKAIGSGDKMAIADLVADPTLAGYPLAPDWERAAKSALAEVKAVRDLISALEDDDASRLLSIFDARVVRQNSVSLAPYRDKLLDWVRTEILPAEKMGIGPPLARKGLTMEASSVRICWKWPEPRFCDRCIVTVGRSKPQMCDNPKQGTALSLPIERKSYEEGGGSRTFPLRPEYKDFCVVVWAVVDLGFQTVYSEPVVLGRVTSAAPHKSGGRF